MAKSLSSLIAPWLGLAAAAGLLVLPSCGGGSATPAGPGTGFANLELEQAYWGRLVDVFDEDGNLFERDVVVRESIANNATSYNLVLNPITQAETLTIAAPMKNLDGSANQQFESLFNSATSGLAAVTPKGRIANGTYTRVARNGAIKLVFSEILAPATVNRLTVQLMLDDRVADVRYIVKESVGKDGEPKGVIVMDSTISARDAAKYNIPENGVGLRPSVNSTEGNAVLRIPTVVEKLFGQTQVLTNKNGTRNLAPTKSDPTESSQGLNPVVLRVMRSGNSSDPANGFMIDNQRPTLQADLETDVLMISTGATTTSMTYRVRAARCRPITPKVGDVVALQTGALLVTSIDDDSDHDAIVVSGGIIDGFLVDGDYTSSPLDGGLTTLYQPLDQEYQLCWLRFDPEPVDLPGSGVDPFSTVSVRFNEAIDPATVLALETFMLHSFVDTADEDNPHGGYRAGSESVCDFTKGLLGYTTTGTGSGRIYLGPISVSADSRTFTMAPSAGISDAHDEGVAGLNVALALCDRNIFDLAGNPLGFQGFVAGNIGQAETITMSAAGGTYPDDRYFALRANSLDENQDGLSEYTGQFVFDSQGLPGKLKGRDIMRFSRQADPSNTYVGQRAAWKQSGLMTPLTPGGAVLQTVYGYHHLGLGLTSPSEFNLDIEGLSWAPFDGNILDDVFDRYSIALAHSNRYPDDYIDPLSGYPAWGDSGLRSSTKFDNNILGFKQQGYNFDEQIVFDQPYSIAGANSFVAESGAIYAPWPDFTDFYTWRDTGMPEDLTGGANGSQKEYGIPVQQVARTNDPYYLFAEWPTVAAPLLMRFRCYPRGDFAGGNGFQVQIMMPSSSLPSFRVFSFGGNGGDLVLPDVGTTGTKPSGGVATGGGNQRAFGPELYWGQVDFVVRVSRVYTHWFALGGVLDGVSTQVNEPVQQPEGASLTVEWRGTEAITLPGDCIDQSNPLNDSAQIDFYGNYIGDTIHQDRLFDPPSSFCATLASPSDWTTDVDALAAEQKWQFFQLRLTFVANIDKDLEPVLDAYGFAWTVQ